MFKKIFSISAFIIFVSILLSFSLKADELALPFIGEYKSTVFTKPINGYCDRKTFDLVDKYGTVLEPFYANLYRASKEDLIKYYQHIVYHNFFLGEYFHSYCSLRWNGDQWIYIAGEDLFTQIISDLNYLKIIQNYEQDKTKGIKNPVIDINDLPDIIESIKNYSSTTKSSIAIEPFDKPEF